MTKTQIKQAIINESFDNEVLDELYLKLSEYPQEELSAAEVGDFSLYLDETLADTNELVADLFDDHDDISAVQSSIDDINSTADQELESLYNQQLTSLVTLSTEIKNSYQATQTASQSL